MPWSLQTVGSTIFYIPGGSNLPLAGAGTIATNNNGTIIMVGRGTNSIAAYDISGGTWSIPSTIFSTTGRSVAVGNNKYVAVGEGGNTFAITNNGTTWGTIASPPFSTAGYDIVYAGSTWVAVGTGTNSVAYFNGTSWISINNGVGRDYTSKNYTLRYTLNSDTVSGTRLLNDATGIYDASLVNGATINAFSKYGGGSLYVNNTGGWSAATTKHVLLPTIDISSSGFTVSLWIYPINTDSFVFEFKDGTSNGMLFQVVSDLTLRLYPNLGQGASFLQSSSTITSNQWTHCCITISSAQFISIYANGVLYASGTSPVNVFGTKSTSILGSSTLPNTSFNGYIDEFITYPRAISAAEVSNLYNSSSLSTGYGLYYDASVPRLWATGVGLNQIAYASAATGPWTGAAIANMTQVNAIGKVTISTGTIVTVGYGNTSAIGAYSTNYTASPPTFTNISKTFASLTSTGGAAIAYGNGTFVWGGSGSASGNSLASSTDGGLTWTGRGFPSVFCNRVIYANGKFMAFALYANSVVTSSDGISWSATTSTNLPASSRSGFYDSVNGVWYVTGGSGSTVPVYISKSIDNGSNWSIDVSFSTRVGSSNSFGDYLTQIRAIGMNGSTIIVAGLLSNPTTSSNKIIRTPDRGVSWSLITGTTMYFANEVKYNGGVWLCGGNNASNSTILYKSENDGASWTSILSNTSTSMTSVSGIHSDGTRWYISGGGAAGKQFAYSLNNNPSSLSDFLFVSSITMGGGDIAGPPASQLYVAGGIGTNNLQKSSDGTTWASVTSPFSVAVNDVKNNGTYWVAVGEGGNTIATSSDGTIWTGRGTATFSIRGNKVRWNATQNKWYAVGEGGNTLAASTDGTGSAWTGITTTGYVDISGMGLAFN